MRSAITSIPALFAICMAVEAQPVPVIASITVCSQTSGGSPGSCPSGFDTHQMVAGPGGSVVNQSNLGVGPAPDEHSTIFSPGTLGTNQDYLFFLASTIGGNP